MTFPDKIISFLLFLLCTSTFSQPGKESYQSIDSIARTKVYKNDLWQLVNDLTKDYDKEEYKARAIFTWVADNIAYDYKAFNKGKHYPLPKCKRGKDCDIIIAKWKENYTDKVLRQRKSVCDGYSWLLKRMCDLAGLQTDFVSGYVKNGPEDVGNMGTLNHAWNGIILDGKYYYLDVTWAAGGCSTDEKGKLDSFYKRFNEFYWLTPIEKFCLNHYPEDKDSPGIKNYSRERYKNTPYIVPAYYETEIVSPKSGVLQVKLGDTIHFEIKNTSFIIDIEYSTNTAVHPYINKETHTKNYKSITESYAMYKPEVKRDGDVYRFDYVVDKKNLRYIEIYNYYMRAYLFKVKVIN